VVVFYRLWSSWSLVLRALQFTIVEEIDLNQGPYSGAWEDINYAFFCGPWDEIKDAWTNEADTNKIVILDLGGSPKLIGAHWTLLRHAEHDGITDGAWWVGTTFPLELKPPGRSVRRLRHLLSPKEKGRTHTPTGRMDEDYAAAHKLGRFYHPGGLLPAASPDSLVISPSVYGGWVTRRLSNKELLEAWDYSPSTDTQSVGNLGRGLLARTPNKLLHVVGEAILTKHLSSSGGIAPDGNVLQDGSPRSTSLDVVGPQTEVKPVSDIVSQEERWDYPLQMESELVRERAAKDDNADIPVHCWDFPFWNRLVGLNRSGDFILEASARRLGPQLRSVVDILRDFVLIVWRRAVYQSFCRFMRRKHGALWHQVADRDRIAGLDCLRRVSKASFWDWAGGSRLFFWRWPEES
jgi:hypothetical protein